MDNKRIIRHTFFKNGNLFKMTYGYDKDIDENEWYNYEYKTTWSFFGGHKIVEDWQASTENSVNLNPPLKKQVVKIEADKDKLDELLVRAIQVRLYDMGGESKPKELMLYKEQSGQIEYMLPENTSEYEYEITWVLDDEDGTILESGRKKSKQSLLFVDRLPKN